MRVTISVKSIYAVYVKDEIKVFILQNSSKCGFYNIIETKSERNGTKLMKVQKWSNPRATIVKPSPSPFPLAAQTET